MIWFTLSDGNSIAVAPEHVRYILPTESGGTVICFGRDERFTLSQPPTEVAARLRRGGGDEASAAAPAPRAPRARAARSRPGGGSGGGR